MQRSGIAHVLGLLPVKARMHMYLVIDDAPGVWDSVVVVMGKCMIAGSGSSKAVAHHLHGALPRLLQLFADVIGCQCR